MRYPPYIEEDRPLPPFFRVKMCYPHAECDAEATLNHEMDKVLPQSGIRSGDSVAIGVGSRGIANLPLIVKTVCRKLLHIGAKPFVIPAMGSHGGATDAGQKNLLASLGITEESCGVPIISSLDVERIGAVLGEVPAYFSRDAIEANHSVVINRIKPHTKFEAPVESGILKMLCVGMGKHEGALAYHNWALKYGFFPVTEALGNEIIAKSNFRFGIAIVENAYDETLLIEAIPAPRISEREKELLEISKKHFPKLPVKQADVLVIGQIGKEISGAGMDPNVTGRAYDLNEDDFSGIFRATRIAILNLSEKTGGNAIGLGNADIITEKVWRNMNYETTILNALTSMSLRKAFVPIRLPDDRKAIRACFGTIGQIAPDSVRAIIIRDTRHVAEFWASEALRFEIGKIPEARILETAMLEFDSEGNLNLPIRCFRIPENRLTNMKQVYILPKRNMGAAQ